MGGWKWLWCDCQWLRNCTITNNKIGTNAAGTVGVANFIGVSVGGSNNQVSGNVISDSSEGISLISSNSGDTISNNYIGTDVTGTLPLGNVFGIYNPVG